MNLKEISYLTNLDSSLAQAKSLANHSQKLQKETKENKSYKKNLRENNEK